LLKLVGICIELKEIIVLKLRVERIPIEVRLFDIHVVGVEHWWEFNYAIGAYISY
jgi:hypothetical protein